jgi:hypothetical protein
MKKLKETKPYTKARITVLVSIYEEAYKFKQLPLSIRGIDHSPEWKALIYAIEKEMDWSVSELLIFLNLVREHTRKQVRQFLLDNDSKTVRRGKRTRVKRKKKK